MPFTTPDVPPRPGARDLAPSSPTRPPLVPDHPPSVIRLDVPAEDRYLQFLRVSSAAACTDVIDDIDRLDDVRLAVDELAVSVIRAAPAGQRLRVTIESSPGGLTISGRVVGAGRPPTLSDVGEMLVTSICRSYRLDMEDDELVFELVVASAAG